MVDIMTSDEIREEFLSFFECKGHLRVASSSLIPVGDPTLLLTIAGMNQFKPYFSGQQDPPNRRLTSAQKCFRTPDIDVVGDATHCTLFEMLGNFSIGDYFKQEAISYALEFVSDRLGLPIERFAVTIHESDDEAHELWKEVGVPDNRIFRFGDSDNWWGAPIHGDEGPCGPCSELHYDFGEHRGCLQNKCTPNCENRMVTGEQCNRYVELWNLVFMQFYHHSDGTRKPLPAPSIDTGMGLERATIIMQDAPNMYETDLFASMIAKVTKMTDVIYGKNLETDYAIRAVAEHCRSSTFLTADGVVPGNEGRGYVLRRVIRRAIRLGRKIGISKLFLSDMADSVIEKMGPSYPELTHNKDFIHTVLKLEEDRFQQAFENGHVMLEKAMEDTKTLTGDIVFRLWDTYGFPIELTQEIAAENDIEVDLEGFEREMEGQRARARASSQFDGDNARIKVYEDLGIGSTRFTGYESLIGSTVVVGLIKGTETVPDATDGDVIEVVLQETPFYSEGGGQVGDGGEIVGLTGRAEIIDTKEAVPELIVHYGKVTQGTIRVGDSVDTYVDTVRREDTARNHTATHMLHAALRQVLGPHVRQAGSLVTSDRLRFDFSHVKPVTDEEMWQIQFLVNERIRHNSDVIRSENTYSGAIEEGALAFFGDKYGETVRLIEIANGGRFSFEVCGGTHVNKTGEVGSVYVLGESSIGAGMRRIEAVSGRAAERLVWDRFNREERIANFLQTSPGELEERVTGLVEQLDMANHQLENLEKKLSLQSAETLLDDVKEIAGIKVLVAETIASSADLLRSAGDWLKNKLGSGVVVLGAVVNENPMIVAMVTPDLVTKGLDAAHIAREAAKVMGGGGGGRPESAQAGGRDAEKLHEALSLVPTIILASVKEIKD
ncbi:MAG: alanine--tRNA ligase [SAR202 cluster bacterium]|jgi:alanyl-tRNA synthetase|nr:alanine--tRNA ligase [SAR202 cluster bacterium]